MHPPDSHRFDPTGGAGPHGQGWIEVVCGSMFSGKTEELLRRVKRARLARQRVLLFKPRIDNRYDAVKVVSHEGLNADAIPVATAAELIERIVPDTAVVGIDEVQFFDAPIVGAAESLAARGMRVIAAGLDLDWRAQPFGPMPHLMGVAEYVTKLHAVCARCGGPGTRSQRLVAAEGQLFVGGSAEYESRCRACFVPNPVERDP
ncbi:MAG TPA: thymidine kinase [Polyangiaceae bacterium]|jgi:thymidine kinase|nr:thymidine kinase [Polyangiaceae bacterium]